LCRGRRRADAGGCSNRGGQAIPRAGGRATLAAATLFDGEGLELTRSTRTSAMPKPSTIATRERRRPTAAGETIHRRVLFNLEEKSSCRFSADAGSGIALCNSWLMVPKSGAQIAPGAAAVGHLRKPTSLIGRLTEPSQG
jgi:hypothetical protein